MKRFLERADDLERLDAEAEAFAATLRLVVRAAGACDGMTLVDRTSQEIDGAARMWQAALAALLDPKQRGSDPWPTMRGRFAACQATLKEAGGQLMFLAGGHVLIRQEAGIALDWLGDRALHLAEEMAEAIENFDAGEPGPDRDPAAVVEGARQASAAAA